MENGEQVFVPCPVIPVSSSLRESLSSTQLYSLVVWYSYCVMSPHQTKPTARLLAAPCPVRSQSAFRSICNGLWHFHARSAIGKNLNLMKKFLGCSAWSSSHAICAWPNLQNFVSQVQRRSRGNGNFS